MSNGEIIGLSAEVKSNQSSYAQENHGNGVLFSLASAILF